MEFSFKLLKRLASLCFSAEHAHPSDIMSYLEQYPSVQYILALGGSGHGPYFIRPKDDGVVETLQMFKRYGLKRLTPDEAEACLQEFASRHPKELLDVVKDFMRGENN